jgi:hypothetical protein
MAGSAYHWLRIMFYGSEVEKKGLAPRVSFGGIGCQIRDIVGSSTLVPG